MLLIAFVWKILQFLQAIYAKIVESMQAQRIRAKLSIADQRPEGKKSKKCKEIGAVRNLAGCEFFAGCTVHPEKFSSCALFMPPTHCSLLTHCSCSPFEVLFFVTLFDFFPYCPCNN